MFKETLVDGLGRLKLVIAYGVLVVVLAVALSTIYGVVQRQAVIQCEASNETRTVVELVLRSLAEPRESDEPGDLEERQELLEGLLPLLEKRDCEREAREASVRR